MCPRVDQLNGVAVPHGATVRELRAALDLRPVGPRTWVALVALAEKGCDVSLRALESAAADADWMVRRAAVEALGQHALAAAASETIVRALGDPSGFVVRAACGAAARGHIASAHGGILRALRDSDPETRGAAADAIEALWQPTDFEVLWDVHLFDPVARVQHRAAWTLINHVVPETWEVVFRRWVADPLSRHRVWACRLAQQYGSPAVAPVLQSLASDSDGHVRKAAESVLASWAAR